MDVRIALCFPIVMGVYFVPSFLYPVPIRHLAAIGPCEVPRCRYVWLNQHDIGVYAYTGNAVP